MAVFVTLISVSETLLDIMSSAKTAPRGIRYTVEQKSAIVDYVLKYNQEHGRGGQSAASRKFGVTPLSIGVWVNGRTVGSRSKSKVSPKAGGSMSRRVAPLLAVGRQIEALELEVQKLKTKLNSLTSGL